METLRLHEDDKHADDEYIGHGPFADRVQDRDEAVSVSCFQPVAEKRQEKNQSDLDDGKTNWKKGDGDAHEKFVGQKKIEDNLKQVMRASWNIAFLNNPRLRFSGKETRHPGRKFQIEITVHKRVVKCRNKTRWSSKAESEYDVTIVYVGFHGTSICCIESECTR